LIDMPAHVAQQAAAEFDKHAPAMNSPVGWTAGAGVLVLSAYMRLFPWWMLLAAVVGLGMMRAKPAADERDEEDVAMGKVKGDAKAAVQWV
jgi:hypothetical protein